MRNFFWKTLSVSFLIFFASSSFAQKRMVPHLTRADGGFTTQVILTNPTQSDQNYVIAGFDESGTQTGAYTGTVAAGTVTQSSASDFFGGDPVSHFMISDGSRVNVTIAYQSVNGGSPAHVNETPNQATTWRLFPGDWSTVIDGIAVVNSSTTATDITVRHKALDGTLVSETVAIANLAPMGKGLYVLDEGFTAQPQSYFEISGGDSELAVTALRFERPDSSFMWQNLSLEFENPRSFDNFRSSAVVEWNETVLAAVRTGAPRPTVITRSLFIRDLQS